MAVARKAQPAVVEAKPRPVMYLVVNIPTKGGNTITRKIPFWQNMLENDPTHSTIAEKVKKDGRYQPKDQTFWYEVALSGNLAVEDLI